MYETAWEKLPFFIKKPDPNVYLSNNYVVLDFEGTNLDKGSPYNPDNRILFSSFFLGEDHPGRVRYPLGYGLIIGTEFEQQELVRLVEEADFSVAHNSKFEIGWLDRCGADTSKLLFWCTMIAEKVITSNTNKRLNLDDCLERRGFQGKIQIIKKWMKAGICPSEMPTKWLYKYGLKDSFDEHKLFLDQRHFIIENKLLPVTFTRNIVTPVLVDLEKTGMHLDKNRVDFLYQKYSKQYIELERKLNDLTGGINFNSPKQKAEFIFGELKFKIPKNIFGRPMMTKAGNPSTDNDTLALLVAKTKRQKQFLDLIGKMSKVSALLSKYLNKMKACVDETEGSILYAVLNQTRTQTDRLSSTGAQYKIQLQNISRILKPLFSARYEGWVIDEHDYSGLEYYIAVHLGKDENGKQDIENKVDRHAVTASIVRKSEWENQSLSKMERKAIRTDAKKYTFRPLILAAA